MVAADEKARDLRRQNRALRCQLDDVMYTLSLHGYSTMTDAQG